MKQKIFALLAALCLLAGCAGKTEPDAPVIDPAPPTVDPTPVTPTEPSEAEQAEVFFRSERLKVLFLDYLMFLSSNIGCKNSQNS